MQKIAFVGLSFHKKTQSEEFFVELLEKNGFIIDRFWDESMERGKRVNFLTLQKYAIIIMFQVSCLTTKPYYTLSNNCILVPMLDSYVVNSAAALQVFSTDKAPWRIFSNIKILSFSKLLHETVTKLGLYSAYFQCAVQPKALCNAPEGLHGFFWLRRNDLLSWDVIKKLIGSTRFSSMHLHLAADPSSSPLQIPAADVDRYGITTSTWFEHEEDLEMVLRTKNVFFAPRTVEGIGFSFLKAMAMGQCVIAPNFATMNEYIVHNKNGILYDLHDPSSVDFSNVVELGQQARLDAEQGYAAWQASESALIEFIKRTNADAYASMKNIPILEANITLKEYLKVNPYTQFALPALYALWNTAKEIKKRLKKNCNRE